MRRNEMKPETPSGGATPDAEDRTAAPSAEPSSVVGKARNLVRYYDERYNARGKEDPAYEIAAALLRAAATLELITHLTPHGDHDRRHQVLARECLESLGLRPDPRGADAPGASLGVTDVPK